MTDPSRLSDDDLKQMADLLCRYAETELDQWENWRVSTTRGDVFIEVRRRLDADPASYVDLSNWLDRR